MDYDDLLGSSDADEGEDQEIGTINEEVKVVGIDTAEDARQKQ